MRRALLAIALAAAIAGCRTAPVAPPAGRPGFDRTLGAARVNGSALSLEYRRMRVLVDPTPEMIRDEAAAADFILFTTASAIPAADGFRSGQKAVGPPDAAARAKGAGLTNFKPVSTGQRLMLSKNDAFAFLSAVAGKTASGRGTNGYLLEFDNGRNLVVMGPVADAAPVRQFVYGLRDDGKAVHLGFFSVAEGGEAAAAELAALVQPRYAVFTGTPPDGSVLESALGAQMFAGEWYASGRRNEIPF